MGRHLSYGMPRVNESGTFAVCTSAALTHEALVERALAYCDWAAGAALAIRHGHQRPEPAAGRIDVQKSAPHRISTCNWPSRKTAWLRTKGGLDNLKRALDMGVDRWAAFRTLSAVQQTPRACAFSASWPPTWASAWTCTATANPTTPCHALAAETLAYHTERLGMQAASPARVRLWI